MPKGKRFSIGLAFAGAVLIVPAALAWACIPVATLNLSPIQVRPGQEVTVTGSPYGSSSFSGKHSPVVLHFNAIDGPVLATIEPSKEGGINGTFIVPADTKPGNYTVVASQEAQAGDTTWGVPSRALIQVVGEGGAPVVGEPLAAPVQGRPASLTVEDPVGLGTLLMVTLGVGGIAMFVAGMIVFASAARRGATPQTVRAGRDMDRQP